MDDIQLSMNTDARHLLTFLLALIMFSVALGLKAAHFRELARRPGLVLTGVAAQVIGLPLLTLLLTLVLQPVMALSASMALGMMVVAACPGGNVSNFLTTICRGDAALSVSLTAISSVLAVVLTPLSIVFWSAFNPLTRDLVDSIDLDVEDFLVQTMMMLAVPLVLGMIFAAKLPAVAARVERWMRYISFGILMIFIVGALASNWQHLLDWGAVLMPVVVIHNACALLLGRGAGMLAKGGVAQGRALTFEVGIQNSGLGLVILLGHFGGLGGAMLITATWGIWHIISGLVVARYFRMVDSRAGITGPAIE